MILHFNDDLYEGRKSKAAPQAGWADSDDEWELPAYEDGVLKNPLKSIISENAKPYPEYLPKTGRIDTDPDTGAGTWYSPDGSGISINDFPELKIGEKEKADSRAAWDLIKGWVDDDDGRSGSIYTDPESLKSFYISPGGRKIPMSEFGALDTPQNALLRTNGANAPISKVSNFSNTGRIDNDPDGNGTGTWYGPDGSATPMDQFGTDTGTAPANGNKNGNETPLGNSAANSSDEKNN